MDEIWKAIPGVVNREVSNLGRIRAVEETYKHKANRICRQHINKGLLKFNAPLPEGGYTPMGVATCVLLAFVGDMPKRHRIGYKDGNKLNCTLENLCYVMKKGELRKARIQSRAGYQGRKLSAAKVAVIKYLTEKGERSFTDIAREFNISLSYVSRIAHGSRFDGRYE